MKALLEMLVKRIVDSPDLVSVKTVARKDAVRFEVTVPEREMALVVGRHGRVVNALRQVLNAVASRENKSVSIELKS
jgi:predicted RNA-binding protein YlqC (UPF0109 family)